jgi:dihydroflavonol-4-reductase
VGLGTSTEGAVSQLVVTGATGLIGSRVAERLLAAGHDVSALVRPATDAAPLEAIGVRIVRGDLTDAASVAAAVHGCEAVVHSAAATGGPVQDTVTYEAVNVRGTEIVLDAARAAGVRRVVAVSSPAFLDARSATLTERTRPDPDAPSDPYTQTKRRAYDATVRRVADGQDIVLVFPGATYGPTPMAERMVSEPGGNQRIARALHGDPARYPPLVAPWSSTDDVAAVTAAAIDRGEPGGHYLALGATGSAMTIATFVNRAMELAGSDHRVGEVPQEELDDPEVLARFGPTLIERARLRFAEPFFDDATTRAELAVEPLPIDDAIRHTLAWIWDHGFAPGPSS